MHHEDCKELGLTRRIKGQECHVRYLKHLVENPHTIDNELKRRADCIEELKASIAAHEAALAHLIAQRDDAISLLEAAVIKLKALRRERAKHHVSQLIAEYIKIRTSLEEENASSYSSSQ